MEGSHSPASLRDWAAFVALVRGFRACRPVGRQVAPPPATVRRPCGPAEAPRPLVPRGGGHGPEGPRKVAVGVSPRKPWRESDQAPTGRRKQTDSTKTLMHPLHQGVARASLQATPLPCVSQRVAYPQAVVTKTHSAQSWRSAPTLLSRRAFLPVGRTRAMDSSGRP